MTERGSPRRLAPWRFVLTFGVVALLADFVYEGARSVTGPLLQSLGASALLVGVVTGVGEAAALLLRFVSGPAADRSGHFWGWAVAGYLLTVVAVPPLGFAGALWVAVALVIAERVGKAVRSPAKDALLSYATAGIGRGRGFAVHDAIDQVGAILGPLVVAGMLLATGGRYGPSLVVLALPGIGAIALLLWLRARVPTPREYEPAAAARAPSSRGPRMALRPRLPRAFWTYALFTALTLLTFPTFGLLSFHLVARGLVAAPAVPLLYAATMLANVAGALLTGFGYDRLGPRIVSSLPVVAGAVPLLGFGGSVPAVIVGSLAWGIATGIQESTLRATVAGLVPAERRSTAYGTFAAVLGLASAAAGAVTGALYQVSVPVLIAVSIAVQLAALVLLWLAGPARRGAGGMVEGRPDA